jgi:hypothetical protein
MNRLLLLTALFLLAGCGSPAPPPEPMASRCPDTMRDVDRVACWVSAGADGSPLPGQKPTPPLLRGPDGEAVIGPKTAP